MKERILEKSHFNANYVGNVLVIQEIVLDMRKRTSKTSHINANCATSVSARQFIYVDMKRHIQGRSPLNANNAVRVSGEKWVLKVHGKTHSKKKPYQCHVCGKRFTQSGNLRRHEVNYGHARAKPFECLSGNQHEKNHTAKRLNMNELDEREHKLELVCNDSFAFGASLSVDKTHQVESYSCWICQMEVSTEASLLEHYDDHMNGIPDESSEDTM